MDQYFRVSTEQLTAMPVEGCTRCACGAKYWDGIVCHSCKTVWDGKDYTEA